jgi:hypothetical protein
VALFPRRRLQVNQHAAPLRPLAGLRTARSRFTTPTIGNRLDVNYNGLNGLQKSAAACIVP